MSNSHAAAASLRASLTLALATALACSSGGPAPIVCDSAESCPPASRCLQRACVADAAPLAFITPMSGLLEANAVITLDGSRSSDPDAPDDAVVAYAWTVRTLDAPCAPPIVTGTAATAPVRFACAGRYEVSLVVADELAVQSEPATAVVDVAPRSGTPLVTAGADLAVDHRCEGQPVACRLLTELGGAVALSASSVVEGVSFRWTVEAPPGIALDGTRRVTFDPGPDAASPTALIATDGTAISGDWVFRVEARDAAGVVGMAATRVSVGNAPPVVTETIPVFQHAFDAASSRFSARGAIGIVVSDPDGDPLEGRTVSGHHVGDGGATFEVTDLGDRAAFSVELPYSDPIDAAFLIGGEGLERAITFSVRDVNGAEASETWPVVIGNRPPELAYAVTSPSTHHVYDAAAGAYRASAALSLWRDPDGDPMVQADPTGDAACPTYAVDAGGRVRIECSLASAVAAVAGNFVGPHDIQERVGDPWAASPAATVARLEIGNRPPVVTASGITLTASCVETTVCCDAQCLQGELDISAVYRDVGNVVSDPDGDPVRVTLSPGTTRVCLPADCAFSVGWGADVTCSSGTRTRTYYVSATDGAATATGSFLAMRVCGP